MELASTDDIYERTKHPYTEALLSSVPMQIHRCSGLVIRTMLSGEIPNPVNPPSGLSVPDPLPPRRAAVPGGDAAARRRHP